MKTRQIVLLACLPLAVAACKGKKADNQMTDEPVTTEMTSDRRAAGAPHTFEELKTDFVGAFTGTLPCADCPGILTTLTLNADGTYTLESVYQDKGDGKPFIEKGKWTPSEDLAFIELNYDKQGQSIYYALIDKNTLEKLDNEAKPIVSEMNHRLVRK